MLDRPLGALCALAAAVFAIMLAGCGAPLGVTYEPVAEPPLLSGQGVWVLVLPFEDARVAAAGPRDIGAISAPVADMSGARLVLSEDVASLVGRAYEKELALAGYSLATSRQEAGFVISGEVRELSYSVGSRDESAVVIAASVVETETGRTLWSGVAEDRGSRFAGVMGNTRASISAELAGRLSRAVTETLSKAGPFMSKAAPAYYEPTAPGAELPAAGGAGRVIIQSAPSRSKVYIGDIYYGLTPLSLDMPPGVYEIKVEHKGFKGSGERVSVRKGQATELELELEPE